MKRSSEFSLSKLALSIGFLLISGVSLPFIAAATVINVNNATDVPVPGLCNLRQAIVSHNQKAYVFPSSCEVGNGDDRINLNIAGHTIDMGSPLNPIENGKLLIIPGAGHKGCLNLRQAAYMTVRKGATLDLANISIVVNGAEFRSIIDNDGGTLAITHGTHVCLFSNQSGKIRKTSVGGVLHNRNGGFARIDANFENNSAADKGGAIYIDSGTVQISRASVDDSRSSFDGNSANQGGAIYVNSGTLDIAGGASFKHNSSNQGGAIYVNGGTVTIAGGEFSGLTTFQGNSSDWGGAIYVNSGTLDIAGGASFKHNSSNQGGAIYVNGGTVTIANGEFSEITAFQDNSSDRGGAIYVNSGAKLNVLSNDFAFMNNRADSGGGGIYSNGGNVTVIPTPPVRSASIRFNRSFTGAAIYSAGGQLSVDGVEINNNDSRGNGGAIVVADIKPPTPASITRSYFHGNLAGANGGAIYVLDGSTLNLSASTFTRDHASGLGGSVYVDTLSNLNVLNSTFLGGANREGIVVASGLGNVVFSTIVGANLGVGSTPTTHMSNSILRQVTCATVVDEGSNLQFQGTGCPVSIPVTNPDLDPRFLENNGGPTPTIALLPGSPAIGAIAIGDCIDQNNKPVTTDQRGFGRPDSADPSHCDIGAYEFGAKQ